MNESDADRALTVGELAAATGLTVRALHHYDQLGLLSPARGPGERRRYGPAEVRRLHQILALRGFGLPLAEIAHLLDGGVADPRELLRRQLEQTEQRITAAQRLRRTILGVLAALPTSEPGSGPPADRITELIERMIAMDHKFTPEQLEQMSRQRQEMMAGLSPEELTEMQRRRTEATSRLTPEQLAEMQENRRQMLPEGT